MDEIIDHIVKTLTNRYGSVSYLYRLAMLQFAVKNELLTTLTEEETVQAITEEDSRWEANCYITMQLVLNGFCKMDDLLSASVVPTSWQSKHFKLVLDYLAVYRRNFPEGAVRVVESQARVGKNTSQRNKRHSVLCVENETKDMDTFNTLVVVPLAYQLDLTRPIWS